MTKKNEFFNLYRKAMNIKGSVSFIVVECGERTKFTISALQHDETYETSNFSIPSKLSGLQIHQLAEMLDNVALAKYEKCATFDQNTIEGEILIRLISSICY